VFYLTAATYLLQVWRKPHCKLPGLSEVEVAKATPAKLMFFE